MEEIDFIEFDNGNMKINCNDLDDEEYEQFKEGIQIVMKEFGYTKFIETKKENGNDYFSFKFNNEN